MNVVLMTSRSGSSMVCRVLAEHGLRWKDKAQSPRQHPRGNGTHGYATYEHPGLKATMKSCVHKEPKKRKWPKGDMVETTNPRLDIMKAAMQRIDSEYPIDFVKAGVEFAQLWDDWAALAGRVINFIKVYRPPEDIAASLERRGIGPYDLGYEVAIKRIKLMAQVPGFTVATNMLIDEVDWEYSGIKEAVLSCGVEFDLEKCRRAIQPEKFHV